MPGYDNRVAVVTIARPSQLRPAGTRPGPGGLAASIPYRAAPGPGAAAAPANDSPDSQVGCQGYRGGGRRCPGKSVAAERPLQLRFRDIVTSF